MAARKQVVQMRSINVEMKQDDIMDLYHLSKSRGYADTRIFAAELLLGALKAAQRE